MSVFISVSCRTAYISLGRISVLLTSIWPVVTDRLVWSTGRPVTVVSPENGLTNRDAVWNEDSDGPKEPCIRWMSMSTNWKGQSWGGKGQPAVSFAKNGWTDRDAGRDAVWVVDSGGPMEPHIWWGAHWRHLACTIEPFMCGGNAALCQITLTTCCTCSVSLLSVVYIDAVS